MATNSQIGSGTIVSYDTGGGFTPFAELESFNDLGISRPEVDMTHVLSTEVDRIAGLKDGEKVKMMFNFIAADFTVVKDMVDVGDPVPFQFEFQAPNALTLTCTLVPLAYKIEKVDAKTGIKFSMETRVTGDIT